MHCDVKSFGVNLARVHRLRSQIIPDFVWSAFCRRLVQWREENSHWRCVTYILQLQTHLFCSGAASALLLSLFSLSLSSSPFPLMLSRSLQPLTWCFSISVNQPLAVQLCQSPSSSSSFWHYSSSVFPLFPFFNCPSHSPACSACVGVRLQLCLSQTAL